MLFPSEDNFLIDDEEQSISPQDIPKLLIKTPQARKRKVNLNDLIEALQKALEVENRRVLRRADERILREIEMPAKKADISILIKNLYTKIKEFFKKRQVVLFSDLLPSQERIDKVYTFIPLLHLENQGKIDLFQEKQFGAIQITEHE